MKFKKFKPQFALAPNAEGGGEGGGVSPEQPQQTEDQAAGLKKALESERALRAQSEREFKQFKSAFEGIDPQIAKQAQAKIEEARLAQEQWNERENALKQNLSQEHDRRLKVEVEKAQSWQQKHDGLLKRTLAQQAYDAAGGRPGGSEDDGLTHFEAFYALIEKSLKLNEKGAIDVIDGSEARVFSKKNTAEPMSAAEFFGGYIAHPVLGGFFVAQNNSKGGGMNPNAGGQGHNSKVRVIDRTDMAAMSEPGVIEGIIKGTVIAR